MLHQNDEKSNPPSLSAETQAALLLILSALDYTGPYPRREYQCLCPAHDDHTPSLSVRATEKGKILLHCFAGCRTQEIVQSIGLTMRHLSPPYGALTRSSAAKAPSAQAPAPKPPAPKASASKAASSKPAPSNAAQSKPASSNAASSKSKASESKKAAESKAAAKPKRARLGKMVANYYYRELDGRIVCEVIRYEPKDFRQLTRFGNDWSWGIRGIEPPLYRLPELHAAPANDWVFIVEGEKDVDALRALGLTATCNIQGAGKWQARYNHHFTNRRVCVLPDNDEPGRQHAQTIMQNLTGVARQLQWLELPNLPDKGDVSDWLAAGGDAATLLALVHQAANQRWLAPRPDRRGQGPAAAQPAAIAFPRAAPSVAAKQPTSAECLHILTEALGYAFTRNDLDDTIEVNGAPIDDGLAAEIRCKMRDLGYGRTRAVEDAYTAHAYSHTYHPVKQYLQQLAWDGNDQIARLAAHLRDSHPPIFYADGTSAAVAHVWLQRFLIGAVAKVYETGDVPAQPPMLVLDGPQGLGKSTLARWLGSSLPRLTYEGSLRPDDKETPRLLATKWIWEVSELGNTTRRVDREALKAVISAGDVTFRVPYARHPVRKPVLASFIGTINNEAGFLADPTGNRRFLVMTLSHIDHAYAQQIDIHQLWAHAYALYCQGEPWQLLAPEAAMQSELNSHYQQEDPLEAWVHKYYECDPARSAQYHEQRLAAWFVTTGDIAAYLSQKGLQGNTLGIQQRLAITLKAMGLHEGRAQGARGPRGYYGIRLRPET